MRPQQLFFNLKERVALCCPTFCAVRLGVLLPLSGPVPCGSLCPLRHLSASSLHPVVPLTLAVTVTTSCWFSAPSSDSRAFSGGGVWGRSTGRGGRGQAACWCRSRGAGPTAHLEGPLRCALSLLQKVGGSFSHYLANLSDEQSFGPGSGRRKPSFLPSFLCGFPKCLPTERS